MISGKNFYMGLVNKDFRLVFMNDQFRNLFLGKSKNDVEEILKKLIVERVDSDKMKKASFLPINNAYYNIIEMSLVENKMYVFVAIDYSDAYTLKNLVSDLEEEIEFNTAVMDSLQDGIFITDEKGIVLYINKNFLQLSGLSKDDVIGKDVFYLLDNKIVPNSCCAKVIESNMPASTINKYYTGKECLVSGNPIFNRQGQLKRVVSVIRDLSELQKLKQELEKTTSLSKIYKQRINELETEKPSRFVSNNKDMQKIDDMVTSIANIDSTILIIGETGVGKDFLAKKIHNASNRSKEGPFLKINCSAIPENLLESELFGYEKGAFTGANKSGKLGLFELANEGTLFLDEIGDMPYNLQSKLLTVLQDKEIYRLGGNLPIKINSRIIAATNANLEDLINKKKFRIDLYYRLNVIKMTIPPLRQRKEDIISLSDHFLFSLNEKHKKNKIFTSDLYQALLAYSWPGNIRELQNTIERLVIMTKEDQIGSEMFNYYILDSNDLSKNPLEEVQKGVLKEGTLRERLESFEKQILEDALRECGTLNSTANFLDITMSTLVRRKRKYGI